MNEKLAGAKFPLNDGISHYLSCFGYVDGRLYIGSRHHMGIMEFLISHGYTFESLMEASQAWGWIDNDPFNAYHSKEQGTLQIRFSTDAAAIDVSLEPEVCAAFEKALGLPTKVTSISQPTNDEYAPSYQDKYEAETGYYKNTAPIEGCYVYDSHDGWLGWVNSTDTSKQFPPPRKEETQSDQLQLFDHPVPGGGTAPPKKGPPIPASEYVVGYNPPKETSWKEVDDLWYDDGDVDEDFLAPPHISSEPAIRFPWMLGMDHEVRFGKPDSHHVDMGYQGNEPATGDIRTRLIPGQTLLRVLDLDPEYDFEWVARSVEQAWNSQHPESQVAEIKNSTPSANSYYPGLTNYAGYDILHTMKTSSGELSDPENNGGFSVYQMESGEYPNHHAVVVDRNKHRIFVNYNGHHGPLMDAASEHGISLHDFYDSVMGHYRLEPSDHEPFGSGWGFHNGEATPQEKDIIAQYMKVYHNVADLEDAWVENKVAKVQWLKVCSKSVKWQALYNPKEFVLYLWETCGDESHHAHYLAEQFGDKIMPSGNFKKVGGLVQAGGTYVTPEYVVAPGSKDPVADTAKVKKLLEKALTTKWPTVTKETNFALQQRGEV